MIKTTTLLLSLILWTTLMSCKTTPDELDSITRIPYSRVAADIAFWNERKESPFVSLSDFNVSIKSGDSFELYLINKSGEKRLIERSNDISNNAVRLPKMPQAEAESWTLVVNKPEWQVRITPNVKIVLPSEKVRYRDLFVILKDYDRRRDEIDTMPGWLRQDFYRFYFIFSKPSTVVYVNDQDKDKDKQTIYETENDLSLMLKLNDEYFEENGWLVFSEIPHVIMPLN